MLKTAGRGLAFAAMALAVTSAFAISQSGEQKDMRRVGHSDLQGRPAYHPTFLKYGDGRIKCDDPAVAVLDGRLTTRPSSSTATAGSSHLSAHTAAASRTR